MLSLLVGETMVTLVGSCLQIGPVSEDKWGRSTQGLAM